MNTIDTFRTPTLLLLLLLLAACTPEAGTDEHTAQDHATESPYVSEAGNTIKALTAQDVDNYLRGAGMGFAKAAELNSYPGPKHVLELADELQLTDEQKTQVEAIFAAMQAEAQRLGATLVEQEQALDALFAEQTADAAAVRTQVEAIGATRAAVRFAHLNAHLETQALLSNWQIRHYDMVRGYADHSGQHGGGAHQHEM